MGSDSKPVPERIWVIDVGNSNTSLGIYADGKITQRDRVPTASLAEHDIHTRLAAWQADHPVSGAAVASVAPAVNGILKRTIAEIIGTPPLRIRHDMQLGASLTYPEPETIGEDRLANLAGAVARYRLPAVVVDIGTATTFDIIQPRKGYAGGIIAPGPALMLDYLAEKTALLPPVDLTPVRAAFGKSTEQAMRIGALHGYRGMVKEICTQLMRKLHSNNLTLCATGGYARWVLKGMELPFIYDPDLTLYGIGRIYELNANRTPTS